MRIDPDLRRALATAATYWAAAYSRAERQARAQELLRRVGGETEPLIAVYDERGVVVKVDGMGDIAEVQARIFAALESVVPN